MTKQLCLNILLIIAFAESANCGLIWWFDFRPTLKEHCLFTLGQAGLLLGLYAMFWVVRLIDHHSKRKRPFAWRIVAGHIIGFIAVYIAMCFYYHSLNPLHWNIDWKGFTAAFIVLAIASGGLRLLVQIDSKKSPYFNSTAV
ncbi:hypothetical protein [Chitinophaga sp. 212800010-3]|uniref:hypothetical protein n=1 Tax=unclassified Chitinophaga TaxID=2619133 RepID=UPI002DF3E833|nr:hypothetical protein [Chitinophaga sp. 212800010-3]